MSNPSVVKLLSIVISKNTKFVAVETKYTWVSDNFMYYTSPHGDWVLIEFDHFFKNNKDIIKAYSGTTPNSLPSSTENTAANILHINTN